jgi:hypothetical protein
MTAYSPIADSEIDPESPGTTLLFTNLRNNPIAMAEGATGAPKIKQLAMDDDSKAGNYIDCQDSEIRTFTNAAYAIKWESKIGRGGVIRVFFSLLNQIGAGVQTTYAKVYINGSPIGVEKSHDQTTYANFSDDITVSADDLLQIYVKTTSSTIGELKRILIGTINPVKVCVIAETYVPAA